MTSLFHSQSRRSLKPPMGKKEKEFKLGENPSKLINMVLATLTCSQSKNHGSL